MAWAVEQSIYDNGKTRTKVRASTEGEKSSFVEKVRCDFYIDVFETEKDARDFAKQCKDA